MRRRYGSTGDAPLPHPPPLGDEPPRPGARFAGLGSVGGTRRAGLGRAFPRERIRRAVARPEAQGASAARAVPAAGGAESAPPASGGWGGRRRRPSEVAREARRFERTRACLPPAP